MVVPVILMALYLMWEKQIVALCKHKKILKKEPVIKQRVIWPLEAMGRFWSLAGTTDTAQRSEYWGAMLSYGVLFWLCGALAGWFMLIIWPLVALFFVVPTVTLGVRRWHDIGLPGYVAVIAPVLLFLGIISSEGSEEVVGYYCGMVALALGAIQAIAFLFPSKLQNNKYRTHAKDKREQRLSEKHAKESWVDLLGDDDD